jgi:asparagine synthase (glutamine-hydrolysing)
VVMKAGDMEKVMPDLIWHIEDLRVGQSYPNYYVARLASKFVKVVLSGAGGDELFAGYPWRYFHSYENDTADQYLEKYYRYWQRLIPDSRKPEFYQASIYPRILDYQVKDVFKSIMKGHAKVVDSPEGYVNNSLYFEIRTFLHGLLVIEDKISMAHSLETRLPMLDNELVDFAMKIPVRYKLNNITKKYRVDEDDNRKFLVQYDDGKIILRKALRHYISDTYADGIKQGFSAPDASWFKGESINYIKSILFNNQARIYEYIQPGTAHKMIEEHFKGRVNRRLLIWSLLCFEWWNKIFIK